MAVLGLYQGKCFFEGCDCGDEQVWVLDDKERNDDKESMTDNSIKFRESLMITLVVSIFLIVVGVIVYVAVMNSRIKTAERETTERIRIEQCSTLSDETARALCVTDRPNERG
jgi:hypothetical protein